MSRNISYTPQLLIIPTHHLLISLSPSQITQNGSFSAYAKYAYDAFLQRIRIRELVRENNKTFFQDVLLLYQKVKPHKHRNQIEEQTRTKFFFLSHYLSECKCGRISIFSNHGSYHFLSVYFGFCMSNKNKSKIKNNSIFNHL